MWLSEVATLLFPTIAGVDFALDKVEPLVLFAVDKAPAFPGGGACVCFVINSFGPLFTPLGVFRLPPAELDRADFELVFGAFRVLPTSSASSDSISMGSDCRSWVSGPGVLACSLPFVLWKGSLPCFRSCFSCEEMLWRRPVDLDATLVVVGILRDAAAGLVVVGCFLKALTSLPGDSVEYILLSRGPDVEVSAGSWSGECLREELLEVRGLGGPFDSE